jgi:hypothetical protein
MDMTFFKIAIPVASAALGYLVGFWMQKWKAMEARRNDIEKLRRPIYAEALDIVFNIENSRHDADKFESSLKILADWLPAKANYFPPRGTDAVFGIITYGFMYSCDMHNRETEAKLRSRILFHENLQKAKLYFMNNEDIRWLPEDLKQEK